MYLTELMARMAVRGGRVGGVRQLLLLVVSLMSLVHGTAALKVGFYNGIGCPNVESTVKAVVQSRFKSDKTITPALLRLFFHDCFVKVSSLSVSIKIKPFRFQEIKSLT